VVAAVVAEEVAVVVVEEVGVVAEEVAAAGVAAVR
jgi:hypothetical protein